MSDPEVSIVLPLTGGAPQALRCLEAIASIQDVRFETIVIDDASFGLASLLRSLGGDVRIVREDRRIGLCAAAQRGFQHAKGEIVALLRDAAVPSKGWLAPLRSALEDPEVGLAASRTAGPRQEGIAAAWSIAARREDLGGLTVPSAPSHLAIATIALAVAERGLRAVIAHQSVVTAPSGRDGIARRTPGEQPELTIVIPTLDAISERLRRCVAAIQETTDCAYQVVIVDNGAPPQGFSAPVNAGVRAAHTPYVVVMNDDVEPLPGWWPPLRAALEDGAAVAFPLTVQGRARKDFAAWCFAIDAPSIATHQHAPGELFDPALTVWYQDTDLLCKLLLAGTPPVLVESSQIKHGLSETVNTEDEALRSWVRAQAASDRQTFVRKHPGVELDGAEVASA